MRVILLLQEYLENLLYPKQDRGSENTMKYPEFPFCQMTVSDATKTILTNKSKKQKQQISQKDSKVIIVIYIAALSSM